MIVLVRREQGTLRWPIVREALWLLTPRSPSTDRVGGKLWLIVIPLILITAVEGALPTPGHPENHDLADLVSMDAVQDFLSGAWGWYGLTLVLFLFNTVLGEELLFRGLLLPRMNGAFGRGDWVANGVLFAGYHLHEPWRMPATLVGDTFAMAYPTKRYRAPGSGSSCTARRVSSSRSSSSRTSSESSGERHDQDDDPRGAEGESCGECRARATTGHVRESV